MLDSKEKKDKVFSEDSSGVFAEALDAVLNNVKSSTEESESLVDEDAINRLILDIPDKELETHNKLSFEEGGSESFDDKFEDDLVDFDERDIEINREDAVTVLEVEESVEFEKNDFNHKDVDGVIPMEDFDLSYENKSDTLMAEYAAISKKHNTENDEENVSPIEKRIEIEETNVAISKINHKVDRLLSENSVLKQQIIALESPVNQYIEATEEIDGLKRKQNIFTQSLQQKVNEKPAYSNVALGTALLSFLLACGMGAVGYGAKSDVAELTGLVASLEKEVVGLKSQGTTVNLTKIDDKINLLIENDNHLNEQLNDVSKVLQSGSIKKVIYGLVEKNSQTSHTLEQLIAKVDFLEQGKASVVSVSTEKKKTPAFSKVQKKIATVAQNKQKKTTTVPVKENKTAIAKRKKASPLVSKKANNVAVKAGWVVNLASFIQRGDAEAMMDKFKKKGVFTEIFKVKVNGSNWFRLRAVGFNTKYQAASFAVKAKKSLGLSSTWIAKS